MLTKKQIEEIKEHLEKAQNPLFFFDNDPDGLCSFLLLRKYLGRGKGFPVKTKPELSKEYFRKIRELKPDYLFILDQPEVSKEFFEEVEKINLPVVWIDHHKIDRRKIPKFVNYYNPLFNKTKKDEPVTALCYQISNKKEDMWLAVAGCIADNFLPDFYSEFKKNFAELAVESQEAFDVYYNSKIGKIAKMLGFALMDRTTNVINMLKFLAELKSPYDFLEENSKTHSIHNRFYELYEKYKKLVQKAKQEIKDTEKIFFFQYGGDVSMSADIANRLKYLFPEKIIVVIKISGLRASLSIRGKNILDKVIKVIKELEGATGGGHEEAVGVQLLVKDLETFKEKLTSVVK